jgi:transposase
MNRDQFWLIEAQFSKIAQLLPTDTRGNPRVDDLRVISGIIHVLKSGCRWVDAPLDYGPRKTPYNRYVRWGGQGRLDQLLPRARSGRGAASVDSETIRQEKRKIT